jgi:hypothetical protein
MAVIAVLDSGVFAGHPHIGRIRGGYNAVEGSPGDAWMDELGHGTAVTAAIQDLHPEAEILAVKIFQRQLRTDIATIRRGALWALEQGAEWLNLSLGTAKEEHRAELEELLNQGGRWVSAAVDNGIAFLPGSLPGAIGVVSDAQLARHEFRQRPDGLYAASPYPREIPGVPPERNLKGISFAVANLTALLSRQTR